jgi:holo-[acyl-carrier protein] synthase
VIHGIGTDIVRVARMQTNLEHHGERFAARVLSDVELAEFTQLSNTPMQARFLAKRFAAKEAAAKALGTGFRDGLSLKHVVVAHDEHGKPLLQWHGAGSAFIERFGVGEGFLSIADESDYAIAYVVLLKKL